MSSCQIRIRGSPDLKIWEFRRFRGHRADFLSRFLKIDFEKFFMCFFDQSVNCPCRNIRVDLKKPPSCHYGVFFYCRTDTTLFFRLHYNVPEKLIIARGFFFFGLEHCNVAGRSNMGIKEIFISLWGLEKKDEAGCITRR